MIKYVIWLMTASVCLFSSTVSHAYVYGPSNLGVLGYPAPNCYEPSIPYSRDEYAVMAFENEFSLYKQCIETYLEAAENDQKRILNKANDAISNFNSFVSRIR